MQEMLFQMEAGVPGHLGEHAVCHVEEEINQDQDYVIALPHLEEVQHALVLLQKTLLATTKSAQ